MAQVKRELEIVLNQAHIPVTGTGMLRNTSHLLTAELIWPRTGVARKSTGQPCALKSGKADFESVNWGLKALFKENVTGRFALGLTLTEALDDEEIEKILRTAAGAAIAFGADAAAALWPPFGKIAAAPLDAIAKSVAKYPGATLLAEGMAELDAADFPTSGGERLLTVRMRAARRLVRVIRRTSNKQTQVSRKVLLEKGAPNGDITLSIKSL
jgi:hypothetical protein